MRITQPNISSMFCKILGMGSSSLLIVTNIALQFLLLVLLSLALVIWKAAKSWFNSFNVCICMEIGTCIIFYPEYDSDHFFSIEMTWKATLKILSDKLVTYLLVSK